MYKLEMHVYDYSETLYSGLFGNTFLLVMQRFYFFLREAMYWDGPVGTKILHL